MAIQYGSTAVIAIKYCNASGVLQDVTSVVRNGVTVWQKETGTWNSGVWTQSVIYTWDESSSAFIGNGSYLKKISDSLFGVYAGTYPDGSLLDTMNYTKNATSMVGITYPSWGTYNWSAS